MKPSALEIPIERERLPEGLHLDMIRIEGGSFQMGSEDHEREQPVYQVKVPDFYLGRYPVTVSQYLSFANHTGANYPEWLEEGSSYHIHTGTDDHYKRRGNALTHPDHPVVGISWENAVAFCRWLSEYSETPYRLPSEAEWEYAVRGGNKSLGFPYAGSHKLKEVAWYSRNSHGTTQTVGLKLPNELGLHDMSGNVWEWCADHWHENYDDAPADGSARKGNAQETGRVRRGGSWYYDVNDCRVADRNGIDTDFRNDDMGFRVARY